MRRAPVFTPVFTCGRAWLLLAVLIAADFACGSTAEARCRNDAECTDGNFCNGGERCVAGMCMSGIAPCPAGQRCNENARQCAQCFNNDDCEDPFFCNGVERCSAGRCVAATEVLCGEDERSVEHSATCEPTCPDLDGDGHRAADCGGDDCDDNDARRYPGNVEKLLNVHDEDCNPNTYKSRDSDGDGYHDANCFGR